MRAEWDAGRCWLGVWVGINIRLAARGANIVKDAYVDVMRNRALMWYLQKMFSLADT